LPGRKGGDGKPIQGPSVRMAEIAISCYQHIRAAARVIDDDGKFVPAQGVVHDLENNVVASIEVKRRVTTKEGKRYSDDMIATTGNAACALAFRNAVFKVIPGALVKPVYEAAKKLAIGDSKSLVQRRADSVAHFSKMGVTKEQICKVLNIKSVDDIMLEHLELLIGFARRFLLNPSHRLMQEKKSIRNDTANRMQGQPCSRYAHPRLAAVMARNDHAIAFRKASIAIFWNFWDRFMCRCFCLLFRFAENLQA